MISKSPDPADMELMIVYHKKNPNKQKTPKHTNTSPFQSMNRVNGAGERAKLAFEVRSFLSASREGRRLSFAFETVWQGQSSDSWTRHGRNQLYTHRDNKMPQCHLHPFKALCRGKQKSPVWNIAICSLLWQRFQSQ